MSVGVEWFLNMSQRSRQRHKETATVIGTGLIINYPLNIFLLFLFMEDQEDIAGVSIILFLTLKYIDQLFLIKEVAVKVNPIDL